ILVADSAAAPFVVEFTVVESVVPAACLIAHRDVALCTGRWACGSLARARRRRAGCRHDRGATRWHDRVRCGTFHTRPWRKRAWIQPEPVLFDFGGRGWWWKRRARTFSARHRATGVQVPRPPAPIPRRRDSAVPQTGRCGP